MKNDPKYFKPYALNKEKNVALVFKAYRCIAEFHIQKYVFYILYTNSLCAKNKQTNKLSLRGKGDPYNPFLP